MSKNQVNTENDNQSIRSHGSQKQNQDPRGKDGGSYTDKYIQGGKPTDTAQAKSKTGTVVVDQPQEESKKLASNVLDKSQGEEKKSLNSIKEPLRNEPKKTGTAIIDKPPEGEDKMSTPTNHQHGAALQSDENMRS